MKIGINGFGRIGRCLLRAIFETNLYKNVSEIRVNSTSQMSSDLHLLKYDSIHGKFIYKDDIKLLSENTAQIKNIKIIFINEKEIDNLNWDNSDFVFECTGVFKKRIDLEKHIKQGAKNIILSCPSNDDSIPTIISQINDNLIFDNKNENIFSIGSCTTNCIAPIVYILKEEIGITGGFITTIHAYTNDQNIMDSKHSDWRRARAGNLSMIPTSTGVTSAINKIFPDLNNCLNGGAIRVPIENVSVADCTFLLNANVKIEEINQLFINYAEKKLNKILGITNEPLVSRDFMHTNQSSIVDLLETKIVNQNLVRILSWYDNEWSFVIRMLEIGKTIYESKN